jgi:hypothetical protein
VEGCEGGVVKGELREDETVRLRERGRERERMLRCTILYYTILHYIVLYYTA